MSLKSRITSYLNYYWGAKTLYNIHSPYLYALIKSVFDTKKNYYSFYPIEVERAKYLQNTDQISVIDLGAGSRKQNKSSENQRSVKDIVASASSHESKCKVLHNLVLYFKPQHILELGTNLGLSAAYMHVAHKSAKLHTVEGDPGLSQLSQALFDRHHFKNISLFNLSFESYMNTHKGELEKVELAYIDGNHTYEATLHYFKLIFNNRKEKKVIVFDDIYWSEGMIKAWNEIKACISNGFVIETHQMGIVIIDPKHQPAQKIKYISWIKKPFSLGIFG